MDYKPKLYHYRNGFYRDRRTDILNEIIDRVILPDVGDALLDFLVIREMGKCEYEMVILTKRFNTKHWDRSKEITEETVTYIADCIHKSPSKMSMLDYKVVLITDSPEGLEFKKWLFYEHTWNHNGGRAPANSPEDGKRD
jgi:hypothetical protein